MRVGILGSSGQLGLELQRAAWPSNTVLVPRARAALDITDPTALRAFAGTVDLMVNAAAYTAVDRAESEPELAFRINRDGAELVARACEAARIPLIHVSTAYVFDGTKRSAYVEDDATAPLGVYGASKAAGEALVAAACTRHVILRTAWVVSAFGNNFLKTMLRLAKDRGRLRVVADQFGCPTAASEIGAAIVGIAQKASDGAEIPAGIYHWTGSGCASWHELASEIMRLRAEQTGLSCAVDPISTAEYPTPARRPARSELDTTKLQRAIGLTPQPWQVRIASIVAELSPTL